jgi:hypothetical protein
VLPGSTAPGVESVRHDVARRLRTAVGEARDPGLVLELARCPENREDAEAWDRAAALHEPGSPGRTEALAELARIDADLRATRVAPLPLRYPRPPNVAGTTASRTNRRLR